MCGSAVISECGKYRYELRRKISDRRGSVLFIMLNPSTADADVDDPTIRRCMSYAESWTYGELIVSNLFAFRATNPKELRGRSSTELRGEGYWQHLWESCNDAEIIVLAWGKHGTLHDQDQNVIGYIDESHFDHKLSYLKLNKAQDGMSAQPAHPLYLKKNLKPTPW